MCEESTVHQKICQVRYSIGWNPLLPSKTNGHDADNWNRCEGCTRRWQIYQIATLFCLFDIPAPANGRVVCEFQRGIYACEFSCSNDYYLVGANAIGCRTNNGTWSDSVPKCLRTCYDMWLVFLDIVYLVSV